MKREAHNLIELPLAAYEAFQELQRKIIAADIAPEMAKYEAIEILKPYWSHMPEWWETTEVVLKKAITSIGSETVV